MRLADAAKYFDRLPVRDAYSGRTLFRAQFDLYDDAKRDAIGAQRRILSMAPDCTLPARLAIQAPEHTFWIVGATQNHDTFGSESIRRKHVVHQGELATICTPGQVITQAGGTPAIAGLAWVKNWKNEAEASRQYAFYDIYFAQGEAVNVGSYVLLHDRVFRCRAQYVSEPGFLVAECDEITGARLSVTYNARSALDPVTDIETTSSATFMSLVFRLLDDYQFMQQSPLKVENGDMACLVRIAQIASPKVGDTVVTLSRTYRVVMVSPEGDCNLLMLRP